MLLLRNPFLFQALEESCTTDLDPKAIRSASFTPLKSSCTVLTPFVPLTPWQLVCGLSAVVGVHQSQTDLFYGTPGHPPLWAAQLCASGARLALAVGLECRRRALVNEGTVSDGERVQLAFS